VEPVIHAPRLKRLAQIASGLEQRGTSVRAHVALIVCTFRR
jgi:hypothetical protein